MIYKNLEEYGKLHKCCPICGNKNYWSTMVAWIFYVGKDYTDKNKIVCFCGWEGTKDDLVEEIL